MTTEGQQDSHSAGMAGVIVTHCREHRIDTQDQSWMESTEENRRICRSSKGPCVGQPKAGSQLLVRRRQAMGYSAAHICVHRSEQDARGMRWNTVPHLGGQRRCRQRHSTVLQTSHHPSLLWGHISPPSTWHSLGKESRGKK